jgi:hypothetical protein
MKTAAIFWSIIALSMTSAQAIAHNDKIYHIHHDHKLLVVGVIVVLGLASSLSLVSFLKAKNQTKA